MLMPKALDFMTKVSVPLLSHLMLGRAHGVDAVRPVRSNVKELVAHASQHAHVGLDRFVRQVGVEDVVPRFGVHAVDDVPHGLTDGVVVSTESVGKDVALQAHLFRRVTNGSSHLRAALRQSRFEASQLLVEFGHLVAVSLKLTSRRTFALSLSHLILQRSDTLSEHEVTLMLFGRRLSLADAWLQLARGGGARREVDAVVDHHVGIGVIVQRRLAKAVHAALVSRVQSLFATSVFFFQLLLATLGSDPHALFKLSVQCRQFALKVCDGRWLISMLQLLHLRVVVRQTGRKATAVIGQMEDVLLRVHGGTSKAHHGRNSMMMLTVMLVERILVVGTTCNTEGVLPSQVF